MNSLPAHLDPDAGFNRLIGQHAETGRWFIKLGQPGFNSPKNNGAGFARGADAIRAIANIERAARAAQRRGAL